MMNIEIVIPVIIDLQVLKLKLCLSTIKKPNDVFNSDAIRAVYFTYSEGEIDL